MGARLAFAGINFAKRAAIGLVVWTTLLAMPAFAQQPSQNANGAQLLIPHFDAGGAFEARDTEAAREAIRFIAKRDDPPFAFERRGLALGLYIDVLRALCEDLKAACVVDLVPENELLNEKLTAQDVILSTFADTNDLESRYAFTQPLLVNTGRFLVAKDAALNRIWPEDLAALKIGVLADSAIAGFVQTGLGLNPERTFSNFQTAITALEKGEIDTLFADGIRLNYFLTTDAAKDFRLVEGAYFDPDFFKERVRFMVAKDNVALLQTLSSGLDRLTSDRDRWGEIYLKYFPFGLY